MAEYVRGTIDLPPWRLSHGEAGIRKLLHHYVHNYASTAQFQGVWEEATHVDDVQASVRRDLSKFLTERIENEFARAQRSGKLGADVDARELARALTAMVDRYCYLTYVFDPPEIPVPVEDCVETLTFVWRASLGL